MSRVNIAAADQMHPDLAEAVRRLVEKFQPERIYLFGSRARGDADEHSDYDILVVVPESNEAFVQRLRIASKTLRDLALAVEVLVLTRQEFERDLPVVASLPARVADEGWILYAA